MVRTIFQSRLVSIIIGLLLLVSFLPLFHYQYDANIVSPQSADEYLRLQDGGAAYAGTLKGFPHTYVFSTPSSTVLSLAVREPAVPAAQQITTLLIVREEQRGVSEVARLSVNRTSWTKEQSWWSGSSYLFARTREVELEPGTYRVEVSSATNIGPYHLTVNDGFTDKTSLWSTAKTIHQLHKYYGQSLWPLYLSPGSLLYVLVGVLLSRRLVQRVFRIWRK